jgi:hypothetical protein
MYVFLYVAWRRINVLEVTRLEFDDGGGGWFSRGGMAGAPPLMKIGEQMRGRVSIGSEIKIQVSSGLEDDVFWGWWQVLGSGLMYVLFLVRGVRLLFDINGSRPKLLRFDFLNCYIISNNSLFLSIDD